MALLIFGGFELYGQRGAAGWPSPLEAISSTSQIYIHGTPVCVFESNGNIVAKVGPCEGVSGPDSGAPPKEEGPTPENPTLNLPPGHPPVTPDMTGEGGPRRVQI